MVMYDPDYLWLARALCDRYAVHLIGDEIMVGFGRTGTFFAHEQAGIRPDFLCLSKGLTGGYLPLSVVMTTDAVYAAFYDDAVTRGFLHSHSYTGNPLACRAALATLDLFAEDQVLERNRRFAKRFTALLAPLAKHPRARHFRQCGMIWAADIDTDDPAFRPRFYREALKREVLLRPLGTTIYFMPPYILGDEDAVLLAERAIEALDAALA
jgi:adenosylmethionine-8-amino-7-oxononanoate aminotransferase